MNRLRAYLKKSVNGAVKSSMFYKIKELQQKISTLNHEKAKKSREHEQLLAAYHNSQFKLTVIDSEDGSTREFRSNRNRALKQLDQIDEELREIEASLQMIEVMKEEVQYEIMMIRRLNGEKVSM